MIYVIGSGLSGMAAAAALVKRGYKPVVLDAGLKADGEAAALKTRMASVEPENWNPEDLSLLKKIGAPAANGIPRKLHFGSEFAYRDIDSPTSPVLETAALHRSFAQGGFSTLWGASIEELPQPEFERWPIDPAELTRYYGPVQESLFLGVSSSHVQPSSQAREFHDDLMRRKPDLEARGIRFGYARLAVLTTGYDAGRGCRYCGQCLYGCPYDSIYNSASTLDRLRVSERIEYRPGFIVDQISVEPGGVRIQTRSVPDGLRQSFDARQVFLAAGVPETARIVLNSTNGEGVTIHIGHSDIFTLPMLRFRTSRNIAHERLHTLCQLVVHINDRRVCRHQVRLQFYGYNDLYAKLLRQRFGPLLNTLAERLFMAFGYLHSDVSSKMTATRLNGKLRIEGTRNPMSRRIGTAVSRKLLHETLRFRAVPLGMELRFDLPGGGYHSGASFPMRRTPRRLETDRWGCLPELPGVHIVDASVLPSVPAIPLGFTVMVNAYRIATECPLPDGR